jgi:hypothetical protein
MNSAGTYARAEGAADRVCAQTRLLVLYDERVPLIDA